MINFTLSCSNTIIEGYRRALGYDGLEQRADKQIIIASIPDLEDEAIEGVAQAVIQEARKRQIPLEDWSSSEQTPGDRSMSEQQIIREESSVDGVPAKEAVGSWGLFDESQLIEAITIANNKGRDYRAVLLGMKVEELRLARGIPSVTALGVKMGGVARSQASRYVNGIDLPEPPTCKLLAEALDVEPEVFLKYTILEKPRGFLSEYL